MDNIEDKDKTIAILRHQYARETFSAMERGTGLNP